MSQYDPTWRPLVAAISKEVASRLKTPPVAPEWLDLRSAAAYLSLTEKALRLRLYKDDPPPSHKLGNLLRFKRSDLDEWMRLHAREA